MKASRITLGVMLLLAPALPGKMTERSRLTRDTGRTVCCSSYSACCTCGASNAANTFIVPAGNAMHELVENLNVPAVHSTQAALLFVAATVPPAHVHLSLPTVLIVPAGHCTATAQEWQCMNPPDSCDTLLDHTVYTVELSRILTSGAVEASGCVWG